MEVHPSSQVNISEPLYEKHTTLAPFVRAKSWQQRSRILWLSRLYLVEQAGRTEVFIWRKFGPVRRITLPSKKSGPVRRRYRKVSSPRGSMRTGRRVSLVPALIATRYVTKVFFFCIRNWLLTQTITPKKFFLDWTKVFLDNQIWTLSSYCSYYSEVQ